MITFEWDSGRGPEKIRANLARLDFKTKTGIQLAFERQAALSTGYMKTTAPWTDRTGAARAGLHTTTVFAPGSFELILAHAVSYGIWLEVCNSGRYQVILPSLRQAMQELQAMISHIWD
jgi:hypothetical protein